MDDKFWLELREPGNVPIRKGPFRQRDMATTLREFIDARPRALISVVTIGNDGPWFEDAPQALEIIDGRSRSVAERHRQSSAAAFAAVR
jgi:hypothetical protein